MEKLRTLKRSDDLGSTYFECSLLKMRYLRVLDLQDNGLWKLPSKIDKLLHLRYLDLSGNNFLIVLPKSITQLHNLQTLKLSSCSSLIELPRNLSKLVNLRHLDINGCDGLSDMPPGMSSMTNLHKLTMFVVTGANVGGLEELKSLNHLKGFLKIRMKTGWTQVRGGRYLINKPHLSDVRICWSDDISEMGSNAEALLQGLQPHYKVRRLLVECYPGVSFPSWGDSSMNLKICLPNLVQIEVYECPWLEQLPLFSQLRKLKVLKFKRLGKLEYVESRSNINQEEKMRGGGSQHPIQIQREIGDVDHINNQPEFPHLLDLELRCRKVKSFPLCPKLETLQLTPLNRAIVSNIRVERVRAEGKDVESTSSTSTSINNTKQQPQGLRDVYTDDLSFLNCHLMKAFQHHSVLTIENDNQTERLTARKVFQSGHLSSLGTLKFHRCQKLKSLSGQGVWEQFTALENLQLIALPELEVEEDINLRCLAHTLRKLDFYDLPKMKKLPKGMQHLTALQSLRIECCENLEKIPAWISCLSSLQSLEIRGCKKLKSFPKEMRHLKCLTHLKLWGCSTKLIERCQEQTGADWHKIQHIPLISVKCRVI
ncbi:putative disease resistance protein RGA4 [Bienertia sinuspersici]